jgi:hypothetical protein
MGIMARNLRMEGKPDGAMELDEGAVKTVNLSKAKTRVYTFLETLATETQVSNKKTGWIL